MGAAPAMAACSNHPDRDASGICIQCRRRVCPECTTKVDGINHCVDCLERAAQPGRERVRSGSLGTPASVVVLIVELAALWLLLWGAFEAFLPGGSG